MKEYFVLGALCLSMSLHALLSGCTMGLVSTQKETQSEQKTSTFQAIDKRWVKFRSKDGINTYIIRDGNGKVVGMRMAKEPWLNIPAPRCYPDTKTILLNKNRQEEVVKAQAPTFPELEKEEHKFDEEKREFVLCENSQSMVEKSSSDLGDDSDSGINAGEKTYSLGTDLPAKWLPGFLLSAMELENGGDVKFKVPISSLDWDIRFGVKFKSERQVISNNTERIVIGLFTISR